MTERELVEQAMTDSKQKREFKVVNSAISVLAAMCAADENTIIDRLTGYLWDEEEACGLKEANVRNEFPND